MSLYNIKDKEKLTLRLKAALLSDYTIDEDLFRSVLKEEDVSVEHTDQLMKEVDAFAIARIRLGTFSFERLDVVNGCAASLNELLKTLFGLEI